MALGDCLKAPTKTDGKQLIAINARLQSQSCHYSSEDLIAAAEHYKSCPSMLKRSMLIHQNGGDGIHKKCRMMMH